MGFREIFLEQLANKRKRPVVRDISVDKLQAFTRRELETAITLYQHLKNMGNTFDDLIVFIETQRRNEQTAHVQSAVRSAVYLTREQRKHMKKGGGKRSRQNDNS
jgi:hypothetical protein